MTVVSLSGDQIRAAYRPIVRQGLRDRIVRTLEVRGSLATSELKNSVRGSRSYRDIRETLAAMVDEGIIVAVPRPTTARGGRPGLTWSLAPRRTSAPSGCDVFEGSWF